MGVTFIVLMMRMPYKCETLKNRNEEAPDFHWARVQWIRLLVG